MFAGPPVQKVEKIGADMNTDTTGPAVIICMKWGSLYGPDYVNVLYNAVADNIDIPFRFVCLTDDRAGILDAVECFDIPDHGWGEGEFRFGGWPKLSVFAKDLCGLQGRALFVDLDTVIVGNITELFGVGGGVVVIREWPRFNDHFRQQKVRGMTSIFSFTIGQEAHILDRYLDDPVAARGSVRHEQAWVTKVAADLQFWPEGWIVSFKRNLLAYPIVNRFVPPAEPPMDAKVVAFHGVPRPIDVVADRGQRWGSWSRYGRGAVPFVRDYWLRYGGQDPT